MLINQTLQKLHNMKLKGMASALEQQMAQADITDLSFEERLSLLIDMESTYRENNRLGTLLKKAKLKHQACIEDIEWSPKRGLDKAQLLTLANCDWLRAHENICITGACGTGKTWISCAIANAAARQGISSFYTRAPRLFEALKLAHADGSIARLRAKIAKTDLLIIDDWGIDQLGRVERQDLLEIIEDRYTNRSTIIASQLPVEHFHNFINDPTIADAILDRILHNAHRITLKGEDSMRKLKHNQIKKNSTVPVSP